jgi:hypothetical protein
VTLCAFSTLLHIYVYICTVAIVTWQTVRQNLKQAKQTGGTSAHRKFGRPNTNVIKAVYIVYASYLRASHQQHIIHTTATTATVHWLQYETSDNSIMANQVVYRSR